MRIKSIFLFCFVVYGAMFTFYVKVGLIAIRYIEILLRSPYVYTVYNRRALQKKKKINAMMSNSKEFYTKHFSTDRR